MAFVQAGALDWQSGSGYRSAVLTIPPARQDGFTIMDERQTGLRFTNQLAESRYLTNQILLNGSGIAAGDIDGDGWCDLYFGGLDGPNALYRNLGNWRFTNITAQAGVACAEEPTTGVALVDVDGDRDLDLLVNGVGWGTRLFLNDGHGQFREATETAALHTQSGATSLTLADVEGDGDLDLYVVNYRTTTFRDEPPKRFRVATANQKFQLLAVDGVSVTNPALAGRFTVSQTTGIHENGEADVFYRNLGLGRFEPINWTDSTFRDSQGKPVPVPYDWGLSAMFRDLNGDGAPDLYVCNDFHSEDRIWINDGRGRFSPLPRLAIRQTSIFSMGLDVADLDRDGYDDIFVADMFSRQHVRRQVQLMERQGFVLPVGMIEDRPQYSRNTLFWNRGDGTYAEIAQYGGVEASDWSWCPVFLDVDLDGYEDLLFVTGHVRDAQNIDISRQIDALIKEKNLPWNEQLQVRRLFQPLEVPNFAFRNRGDLTFEDASRRWGFDSPRVSQGVALADLDNDGDQDVVINCLNAPALLYRNNTSRPRVAVRLRGAPPNTQGIGARITVTPAGQPAQSQEMISGGRYLSCDDALRSFAAFNADTPLTISVRWRAGGWSRLTNVPPNCLYEIDESGAAHARSERQSLAEDAPPNPDLANPSPSLPPPSAKLAGPFFTDASSLLNHRHRDQDFDDFQSQPLLPHKLSQLGPGITWFDLDGDTWEDLIIGAGRGGQMAIYRNTGQDQFRPWGGALTTNLIARDQTTILGYHRDEKSRQLYIGTANYEDGDAQAASVQTADPIAGTIQDLLPGHPGSTGPLAMADIDNDGDLDLFLGRRVIAHQFPQPTDAALYLNQGQPGQRDAAAAQVFSGVGLVSGAVFTDLDADGWPDLVLACQYGPLRLFHNQKGQLIAWDWPVSQAGIGETAPGRAGLNQLTGWWNSVTAGDFDGDGRMDLVAGNWGRNTKYQSHLHQPMHTYYGDVNGDGRIVLVEAYHDPELNKIVPLRDWETLCQAMPFIRERFASFTQFSSAGVAEILGERLGHMQDAAVRSLDSVLLLNRGDHWELRPLPPAAQFSPVFGLAVADVDGDGCEDVVLSQNFFSVAPQTSRCDGGLGAWLKGDGQGHLTAIPPQESGLRIYGEGRGVAVCDYDHDGRIDVAIAQNGQATVLLKNLRGKPGLAVSLQGSAGNPAAVGAGVRLVYANGQLGPTREVHAGAGYWSQDSATLILGQRSAVKALRITWPGGRTAEVALPADCQRCVIRSDIPLTGEAASK